MMGVPNGADMDVLWEERREGEGGKRMGRNLENQEPSHSPMRSWFRHAQLDELPGCGSIGGPRLGCSAVAMVDV